MVSYFFWSAKVVELFCETQIDFEKERYALVENHIYSLLCISFSMVLSNIDSNDMGL